LPWTRELPKETSSQKKTKAVNKPTPAGTEKKAETAPAATEEKIKDLKIDDSK
jgi:hypothetical protein